MDFLNTVAFYILFSFEVAAVTVFLICLAGAVMVGWIYLTKGRIDAD